MIEPLPLCTITLCVKLPRLRSSFDIPELNVALLLNFDPRQGGKAIACFFAYTIKHT